MWRKVNESTTAEPRCGQQGNSLFFDYNNNSAPQPAYNELLSRDWKPITSDNWEMAGEDTFNPCTEGQGLVMSNFNVATDSEGFTIVTWSTDKPATSQLLVTDVNNGQDYSNPSDNILRTEHSIKANLIGLGASVEVIAVSVGEDLSKAMSDPYVYNP